MSSKSMTVCVAKIPSIHSTSCLWLFCMPSTPYLFHTLSTYTFYHFKAAKHIMKNTTLFYTKLGFTSHLAGLFLTKIHQASLLDYLHEQRVLHVAVVDHPLCWYAEQTVYIYDGYYYIRRRGAHIFCYPPSSNVNKVLQYKPVCSTFRQL